MLVRADIQVETHEKHDPPKCNRVRTCKHCPLIDRSGYIKSTTNQRQYKCLKKVTCNSNNIIYCITCNLCQKQYVGQTMNKLLVRINAHYSTIRTKKEQPVADYFRSHDIFEDVPITLHVLQLIRSDASTSKSMRDRWERIWMSRLNSFVPNGLNIMD
jgi:hypothetical protein